MTARIAIYKFCGAVLPALLYMEVERSRKKEGIKMRHDAINDAIRDAINYTCCDCGITFETDDPEAETILACYGKIRCLECEAKFIFELLGIE